MTNFITTDAHGNTITTGTWRETRLAAAEFALRTGYSAFVSEVFEADEDGETEEGDDEVVDPDDVGRAIIEARDWLATDNGDDARLTRDLAVALGNFDHAVEDGGLAAAHSECVAIAYEWASNDRSGFGLLDALVGR